MSDLVIKPENNGKAEIEAAPTKQKIAVFGIVLYSPPNSDAFEVPVRYITAPTDINNKAL